MKNKVEVLEKLISEKLNEYYILSTSDLIEEKLKCSEEIETLKLITLDIKNKGVIPSLEIFNFRELRKNKGLTIEEVKLKTGILDSVISNIENNVVDKPSYYNIKLLLDLYYKNDL